MANMTMIVFEVDGREVMLSDAESIHDAMVNNMVKAETPVTVYLSDGTKQFKPAAEHRQLSPYFPIIVAEPEADSPAFRQVEPAPLKVEPADTTARRLKALEEEIEANPDAPENRAWAPPIAKARASLSLQSSAKPIPDLRDLGRKSTVAHDKNRIIAALLAFFLGGWGVHKFYLGKNKAGAIMLILTLLGLMTSIILIGLPILFAVGVVALAECVIYLITPDEEFDAKYVHGDKDWF